MKEFQQYIDEYLEERDWKRHTSPEYLAKSISIEAAELLEIFQRKGWSREEILGNKELCESIKDELGDIIILSAQLATMLDGDLLEFARTKAEKVKKKYPVELVRGNPDKYYEIKKKHREEV